MRRLYLTASEAADYICLSESYLAKLRMGTLPHAGPKFLRVGLRAIRYRQRDLDEWMESKSSEDAQRTRGRS